ncbi:MAG: 23S rRNA (guanosine2251-2'-O)-methyltransferase [Chloroflexi bacterium]|nr:MAG: 23S rRNA (guanosine2251-2'-O)-methyltransferase [Chloroflexota bacterium]
MALELRNPHSILATLQARSGDVEVIALPPRGGGVWGEIATRAQEAGVPVRPVETPDERREGRRGGRSGAAKQGREGAGYALIEERKAETLGALLERGEGEQGVWLALDSIQDPRNVGAIFRSAAFFGVRGVVLGENRAAALTAVSYDTASGGLESVPFAVETNLRRALTAAKAAGLWILGTSEHAEQSIEAVPRDRDWLLVVGNEERGLRRLTLDVCDTVCAIGGRGAVGGIGGVGDVEGQEAPVRSLNVSVATGIALAMLGRAG